MKNKVLFAALACMAFAGCTNDEVMFDEALKNKEIRFAVASGTEQTRAEHDKNGVYNGKLKVWAWVEGTNTKIIDGDVYDATNNTFDGNKIYYYPVDGKNVDFLAVPTDIITKGYFTNPTRNADGTTDYTFTAGHDSHAAGAHSTDIMTSEIVTQNSGVVGIVLRHLTAKLNVRVQQIQKQSDVTTSVVTLKDVQIKGIRNHGNVTLNQAWTAVNGGVDCMWTNVQDDAPCAWDMLDADHALATHIVEDPNTNFETTGNFYVLPQQMAADKQKMYIKYSVETKYKNGQPDVVENFEKEFDLSEITNISAWAMNKNITYIISMNPVEDNHKITFDVEVEAWGNANGETTVTPGNSTTI